MNVNFPQDRNGKFVEKRLERGILAGNYVVAWRKTTPEKLTLNDELNKEVREDKKFNSM